MMVTRSVLGVSFVYIYCACPNPVLQDPIGALPLFPCFLLLQAINQTQVGLCLIGLVYHILCLETLSLLTSCQTPYVSQ